MKFKILFLLLILCLIMQLFGCGGAHGNGGNNNVDVAVKKIINYLTALSNDEAPGVIVGQNCGHGPQIADGSNNLMGYKSLIEDLKNETGKYVGILGVDYEHDQIFTPAQLSECNRVLINYWKAGGLITINWSPHNPWLNDESNIPGNPGVWSDTRNGGENLAEVDLTKLVDPDEPIRTVWLRKLDRIAAALLELKNAGVVVLWRPMQEMNGSWFWWGNTKHLDNPDAYKNVFIDMHNYFTKVKGLDNLIWVYSPASAGEKDFSWAYPGDRYVDVITTTVYDDSLTIPNYDEMASFNKPMAMAEYGGSYNPIPSDKGSFDNRKYINELQLEYPKIAYFVCWHNWDEGNGSYVYHSISHNLNGTELMNNTNVITRDKLNWTSY
jgi:mannan endo-1,4-beta-mannosidase